MYLVCTREVDRVKTPKIRSGLVLPTGTSLLIGFSLVRPARFLTRKSRNPKFGLIATPLPVIVRCWPTCFLTFFCRMCFGGTLTWPVRFATFFSNFGSKFSSATEAGRFCLSGGGQAGCALALLAIRTERYIGGTDFDLEISSVQ